MTPEYEQGYKAALKGESILNCPYPFTLGHGPADEWKSGFKDACRTKN